MPSLRACQAKGTGQCALLRYNRGVED
jgi:hypothetical protein